MMEKDLARLIDDIGRAITLRKNTAGVYNPATSAATNTTADHAAKGLLLDYHNRERDGTQIKAGDRKAVFKVLGLTGVPAQGDFVIADTKEYRIIDVRIIEESGAAIAYICQIRG